MNVFQREQSQNAGNANILKEEEEKEPPRHTVCNQTLEEEITDSYKHR